MSAIAYILLGWALINALVVMLCTLPRALRNRMPRRRARRLTEWD
jgi:hypothetical protein